MVESIYFLKPAWCGTHRAGLWPEQDFQSVTVATAFRRWFSLQRFNSNAVVYGATYPLLAAEALFCCLNLYVPEEKLNSCEFTTRCERYRKSASRECPSRNRPQSAAAE